MVTINKTSDTAQNLKMDFIQKFNISILFNRFSVTIILSYFSLLSLLYFKASNITRGIKTSVFLVVIFVIWSHFFSKNENKIPQQLHTKQIFHRNLFLVAYSFFLGGIIYLISDYHHIDIKGWWSIFMVFNFIYAFLFSITYSLITKLINKNAQYTNIFSWIIFLFIATIKVWPSHLNLNFWGLNEPIFIIPGIMLMIHFFYCFINRMNKISGL